jgi:Fe-S cluster assembly iron-binding protein IscA
MLTVTDAAASAVDTLLESSEPADGAGLRFQRGVDASGNTAIGVTVVSEPEPCDRAVPAGSGSLYLPPEVGDLLDDQILDAETRAGGVAFTIRSQNPIAPPADGGHPSQ